MIGRSHRRRTIARLCAATLAVLGATAQPPALADVPSRAPVMLPRDPARPAPPIHGSIPGRTATGKVVAVEPIQDGSRVTVQLDRAVGGTTRVTDDIPAGRSGEITRWTDRFDAVGVGDAVTARVRRTSGRTDLTSLASATADDESTAPQPRFGARWSPFGPAFRPWRLPQSWDLQAPIAPSAFASVMDGVGWWQADPLSFWQLNPPGNLTTTPALHDCEDGVPSHSWVRFGEVRESFDGAIGVATYCSDSTGRTAFEVLLDHRIDYDLDLVAAHELGHGIGFGHSSDLAAAMYRIANPKNGLGSDDITGLRALYPGRIAAYATLPNGFNAVGGDPRVQGALVEVVPVGEPGLSCDRASVQLRVDPPAARSSFRGATYDPATGLATAEGEPLGDARCTYRIEAVPRHEDDAGPGAVTLTPVYPGTTVQQATEAGIRLPRAPKVTNVTVSPDRVRPGDVVALHADVSDLDFDLASVAWDTNGDGVFADAFGADATASVATPGAQQVSVRATDSTGLTTTRSAALTVIAPPAAALPGASPPPPPGAAAGTPDTPSSPAAARIARRLVVSGARITRGGRLRFTASFTARANGRSIRVTVRARGRTRTYYQVVRNGRIRFDRQLIRAQAGTRRVTVTLTFRGSSTVAPTSTTVRLR